MAILSTLAYGVIPIGLLWIIAHYPTLRVPLAGLWVHMVIVVLRNAMLAAYVESVFWPWGRVHLVTAMLAASCFLYGILKNKGYLWKPNQQ